MLAYRTLRYVAFLIRRLEVLAARLCLTANAAAVKAGERAKGAAHKTLDRQEQRAHSALRASAKAVDLAQARLAEASLDWELDCEDIADLRTRIDREVI